MNYIFKLFTVANIAKYCYTPFFKTKICSISPPFKQIHTNPQIKSYSSTTRVKISNKHLIIRYLIPHFNIRIKLQKNTRTPKFGHFPAFFNPNQGQKAQK